MDSVEFDDERNRKKGCKFFGAGNLLVVAKLTSLFCDFTLELLLV